MEKEKKEAYESGYKKYIQDLIIDFGSEYENEIKETYYSQRELLEKDAKIKKYLPILAYQCTKTILKAKYKKKYLEKLLEKEKKILD